MSGTPQKLAVRFEVSLHEIHADSFGGSFSVLPLSETGLGPEYAQKPAELASQTSGIRYSLLRLGFRTRFVESRHVEKLCGNMQQVLELNLDTLKLMGVPIQEFSYGPLVWASNLDPNTYPLYTIYQIGAHRTDPTRIKA